MDDIYHGKNISKSSRFKETKVFHSTEKSMFSLRAGEWLYARLWYLPYLFQRISERRNVAGSKKIKLVKI